MFQPLTTEYVRATEMQRLRRNFAHHCKEHGLTMKKFYPKINWLFSATISLRFTERVTDIDQAIFLYSVSDFADLLLYDRNLTQSRLEQLVASFDFEGRYQQILIKLQTDFQPRVTFRAHQTGYQLKSGRFSYFIPGSVLTKLNQYLSPSDSHYKEKLMTFFLRYQEVLNSSNNHLAIPTYSKFKRMGVLLECFASPFNRSLDHYCSAFPDVDTWFGSQGSFFDYQAWTPGLYVANPPYFPKLMEKMAQRIIQLLKTQPNLVFYLTIPVWDSQGLRQLGKEEEANKYQTEPYPTLDLLVNSGFLVKQTLAAKEDYKYHSYLDQQDIGAVDTYFLIVSNRSLSQAELDF